MRLLQSNVGEITLLMLEAERRTVFVGVLSDINQYTFAYCIHGTVVRLSWRPVWFVKYKESIAYQLKIIYFNTNPAECEVFSLMGAKPMMLVKPHRLSK